MTIPDYQTIMLPLLEYLGDQQEHRVREATEHIANFFNLSEEQKRELLPSGQQPIIFNRVAWACTYLSKAVLIERPKRGYVKITERGLDILKNKPSELDIKFLEQYPEYREFRAIRKEQSSDVSEVTTEPEEETEVQTPNELIDSGYKLIRADLIQEILDKLRINSPAFFEGVVLRLLSKMGYGEGEVRGRSGDGGVDGVIYQDKLGLDKIIFQAKRFDRSNTVTASMIRDFVGTLDLEGVSKGVFITTSKFPKNSNDVIAKTHKSIVLINGNKLAQLMIDYDLGVSTDKTYVIKRLDSDFFPEE